MLLMTNGATALSEISRLFAGTDQESDQGVEVLDNAVLTVPRSYDEMVVACGLLQFLTRTGGLPAEGRVEHERFAVELYRRTRNGGAIGVEDLTAIRRIHAAALPYDWHLATLAASILTGCKPRLVTC